MQLAAAPPIHISSERSGSWRSDAAELTTSVAGSTASVHGSIERGTVPNPLAGLAGPLLNRAADSHFFVREHAVDIDADRGSSRVAAAVERLHGMTDAIAGANAANRVTGINLKPFDLNSSLRFGAETRDVYAKDAAVRLGSVDVLQQLQDAARAVIKASW